MDEGADDLDLLAAEGRDLVAMDRLGISLFHRGEVDEAERWLTKAAEQGSEDAMTHLGALLSGKGDTEGAEEWLRIPADRQSGDSSGPGPRGVPQGLEAMEEGDYL